MRDTRLRGFSLFRAASDSWLSRVRENFRQFFLPARLAPTSANGAPIHLLKFERSTGGRRAQTLSLLTHAAAIVAISLVASGRVYQEPEPRPLVSVSIGPLLYSPDTDRLASNASSGPKAGGGEEAPSPANHGFLAPRSSVQLAPPRLPDNANPLLPITATILDAQAPAIIAPQSNLGLPWMPDNTNSAGPGSDGGIGAGKDGGMGDREGPGGGEGESNLAYSRGVSPPICVVCPYPIYTDEARHAKMQGTVTLRVLVGSDGKAAEIRVIRGVGFGLDERAVQTVRGWKFNPARDANQRGIAAWVTIEAVFRLF
ncbi:MAG TPA: energy transducer TonB [Candidatus Saccharimonadales bacterium]|nr:energy transducer TonB [Candidatus Saccharimonadales bacterium]